MIATALHQAILAHGLEVEPREACGVILDGAEYVRCRNIAAPFRQFLMHPDDYAAAARRGTITHIVHTHPMGSPAEPSVNDLAGCEATRTPWVIVSVPGGACRVIEPTGRPAALEGREYAHGVCDCLTLCRDWFRREWALEFPEIEYEEHHWKLRRGLVRRLFAQWGFVSIPRADLRRGDVICFQVPPSAELNHLAICLGDNRILHQPRGRLSGEEPYQNRLAIHAHLWLRHRSRL